LDFARAAALYGLAHERVGDMADFRVALQRALGARDSCIIEVPSDRSANRALHERVSAAVCGALSPPATGAAPRA
jgi:2-succinyl-5-enolpyruvyl-6-hydroxy-3-cyclohexene-1-carboxylate synthase